MSAGRVEYLPCYAGSLYVDSERQKLPADLTTGCDAIQKALSGVDEQMAQRTPSPDRWSILECVEHLAVVQEFLFSKVIAATRSDNPQIEPTRETRILDRGLDRTRPVQAPEPARPQNRFESLGEALAAFYSARAKTIEYVKGFNDDPRSWLTGHPLIRGPVNCYEMLLMMSIHPVRHARQIEETRTALSGQAAGTGA